MSKKILRKVFMKLGLSIMVLTSVMTILVSLSYTFDNKILGKMKNRIEAVYIDKSGETGLSFKDYEKIKANYKKGEASVEGIINTSITTGFSRRFSQVKAVMTDENYLNFFPGINILKGGFISEDSCRNKEQVLVLSKKLANTLFNRIDVIGNLVEISGIQFKIIGVYESDRTLMSNITDDGIEKVFIPYTYTNTNESINVERLMVNGLQYKEGKVYTFKDVINRTLKNNAANSYYISDFFKCETIVGQLGKILVYILGLCCIVIIIKILFKLVKGLYIYLKVQTENKYLPQLLKDNILSIGISIGIIFSYFVLIVVIFNLVRFNLYIPPKYIPPDNIFDLEFYFDKAVALLHDNNAFFKINYVSFNALLKSTMKIELLLIVLAVIFAFDFIFFIRIIKVFRVGGVKKIIYFSLALFIGIIVGYIIAYFMGLSCCFPGKYLLCMLLFLFLYNDFNIADFPKLYNLKLNSRLMNDN